MGQANAGLYSLLRRPAVFNAVQRLILRDAQRILVEDYVTPEPGFRVLDVGCGTGALLPHLGDVDYTGIDPEPAYIDLARARHGARGAFVCAGVEDLEAHDERRVDRVVAIGVLHHLDDRTAALLFEAAERALRPGGRLVTCDPVWLTPQNPLARLVIGLDRGKSVRTAEAYRALAGGSFDRVEVTVRSDLMRIPYDHCVVVCEKQ